MLDFGLDGLIQLPTIWYNYMIHQRIKTRKKSKLERKKIELIVEQLGINMNTKTCKQAPKQVCQKHVTVGNDYASAHIINK